MQVAGVTGRIYGLKAGQTNGKDKVSFRVGVRKQFVTDADKQSGKTMTFMPMSAMGPTATFIIKFFKDGDNIAIGDMEYQTYRTQNADPANTFDDAHIFRVNRAGFVSDGQQGGGNDAQQTQQPPARQQPAYQQQGQMPPQQTAYQQAPPPQQQYQQAPPQQQQQYQTSPPSYQAPMDQPAYVSDDDLPF